MLVQLSTSGASEAIPFVPDLGSRTHRWIALLQELSSSSAEDVEPLVKQHLAAAVASQHAGLDWLKYTFALSVTNDLVSAGANVFVADSRMFIAWPDWAAPEGKARLRKHLSALRDEGAITESAARGSVALPGALNPEKLLRALAEGRFDLRGAKEIFECEITYDDIFAAAVRTWSMPYRDREGRRSRFVLTLTHESIGANVPVGIIEVCDGPPFHPLRDNLMGVTSEALQRWINAGDTSQTGAKLERRFEGIYSSLRGRKRQSLTALYADIEAFEKKAAGRSLGTLPIRAAKSATYAARLARAHRGANALKRGESPNSADLGAIARVCRDLVLPRVSLEISICGSLPPFSDALVGKLVASYMGHPKIRELCRRPVGQILGEIFKVDELSEQMPSGGALLLTTQGLYAGHSAQYQDVFVPGRGSSPIQLQKVGLTNGATASMMSRHTDQLASKILALSERKLVSDEYGSGGSKRQRRIEAAVGELAVSRVAIHPVIRRPYYALTLAGNLPDVVLLNERAKLLVEERLSSRDYCVRTVSLWREKWLEVAARRVKKKWGTQDVPGVSR